MPDAEKPRERQGDDKEFMATLAKGLAVLGCFGKQRPTMTLSEAAGAANLSRATARRILRTLAELGYVEQQGRDFSLSPNILKLGFAYLATQSWVERAQPLLKELSERLQESASAAILEGNEIVYVVRVPTRRIMSASISVGSRLPAFHTALGRVLLGYLDEAEIWRRLKSQRIEAYTPSTITDLQALFDRVRARPRARLRHCRRGARARPARHRGAGDRPLGPGDRRAQSVHPLRAHHPQRDARSFFAGAEEGGGAGAQFGGVKSGATPWRVPGLQRTAPLRCALRCAWDTHPW